MLEPNLISQIEQSVSDHLKKMGAISDFIFKNPELGGEEYIACGYLMNTAEALGFSVTPHYCGLDTAFLAEMKNGPGPVLAIIVEYDALPGFGPGGSPAHACGHNWISAVGMGTAMVLCDLKDEFSGTLRILGTPAMENLGCKAEMIKEHAFDDVDVVIQSHLEHYTTVACKFLALDAMEFRFTGHATHAASMPEEGISALDAAQFTFMGINAQRQYLRNDVKIHGIISEGGEAPSVIPDTAACRYYVRANDRKYLEKIKPRLIRCAEGAALMAGAKMQLSYFENPYDNILNNPLLQELALRYMAEEGIFPSEEYDRTADYTSSDIGNVSHVCPTLYMEFDVEADGEFRVHDKKALNYVNSPFSSRKLKQISKIMAEVLLEIYRDNELLKAIKKEQQRIIRENLIK